MERKSNLEFILRKPGEYLGSQCSRLAAALALAEVGHRVFVGVSGVLLREAVSILLNMPSVSERIIDAEGCYVHGNLVREPIITIFEECWLDHFIEKGYNIFEGCSQLPEVQPILIASTEACSKIMSTMWLDDSSYVFSISQLPADMSTSTYADVLMNSTEDVKRDLYKHKLLSPQVNDYVYAISCGKKLIQGDEHSGLDLYGKDTIDYVNQIMSEPMVNCLKNPDTRVTTHYVNYPTLTQGVWLHFR